MCCIVLPLLLLFIFHDTSLRTLAFVVWGWQAGNIGCMRVVSVGLRTTVIPHGSCEGGVVECTPQSKLSSRNPSIARRSFTCAEHKKSPRISLHCFCLFYYMLYHRLTYSWTHLPRRLLLSRLRQRKEASDSCGYGRVLEHHATYVLAYGFYVVDGAGDIDGGNPENWTGRPKI